MLYPIPELTRVDIQFPKGLLHTRRATSGGRDAREQQEERSEGYFGAGLDRRYRGTFSGAIANLRGFVAVVVISSCQDPYPLIH